MKNTNSINLGFDNDGIFNLVKITYTFTNSEGPTSEQHLEITIDLLEALHEYFNKIEEPRVEGDIDLVDFIEFLASSFYQRGDPRL